MFLEVRKLHLDTSLEDCSRHEVRYASTSVYVSLRRDGDFDLLRFNRSAGNALCERDAGGRRRSAVRCSPRLCRCQRMLMPS
jgi:hypothetical protein